MPLTKATPNVLSPISTTNTANSIVLRDATGNFAAAGITFNDATTLTSANIGTAQLVNGSVIASKLGTNEQKQICKAWVNFNGTTSPGTIRSSYNVSSVTKNGTGDYTVNFATALADANYSATLGSYTLGSINSSQTSFLATGFVRVAVFNGSGVSIDANPFSVIILGN